MKRSGSFTTETEIWVAANPMQVDIYTYNEDRWNVFPRIQIPGNQQPAERSGGAICQTAEVQAIFFLVYSFCLYWALFYIFPA